MKDTDLRLSGRVITKEIDPVTKKVVKEYPPEKNIVTYVGANAICKWLSDDTALAAGVFEHMGIGYGETAAAATQTALVSELGTRVASTQTVETDGGTSQDIIYQCVATFSATESANFNTIWEFGMFSASTDGSMLNRIKFATARDNYNNDLEITYQLTVSSS